MAKMGDLIGAALDWAVAKCEGLVQGQIAIDGILAGAFKPSADWSQGGPIIERELIAVWTTTGGVVWHSKKDGWGQFQAVAGHPPLIAAMRCYVASKLGDEIDIPKELL